MTNTAIKISNLRHEYAAGKKKKSPVRKAALDGMSAQMGAAGIDLGALETAPEEEAIADA